MSKQEDIGSGLLFVNHGLARWHQIRAEWKRPNPEKGVSRMKCGVTAKDLDIDTVVEHIFSQVGKGPELPESVPLSQMIDILIDFWEADGLYD